MNAIITGRCKRFGFCLLLVCALPDSTFSAGVDTNRQVRFHQGVDEYSRGRTDAAVRIFDVLLQEEPDDVGVLYYLGLCYLDRGEYIDASAAFQRVLSLDPELIEAALDAAIAQLGQNQRQANQAARNSLLTFLEQPPADAEIEVVARFFLGLAEYRLENYEASLTALNRAAELDTGRKYTKDILWYKGLALAMNHSSEEAKTEFEKLLTFLQEKPAELLEMTPQTRRRMIDQTENLLRQVENRQAITLAKNYDLRFKLDLGFNLDTNVVLLGDSTALPLNISREKDFRFGLGTDLRYIQRVTDKFSFGLGGSTFHSWHASLEQFNVQTYAGRVFLNYALTDDLLAGIQYDYDWSMVNNAGFLGRNRITPSLRFTEATHEDDTPLTWTTAFYRYEARDYHEHLRDLRTERDGNYHAAGLIQDWNITRLWDEDDRYLHAQVGYTFEADSTQADEFDLTSHGLSLGLDVPLPWQIDFDFTGQWTWEDYWQHSIFDFHRRKREDFVQRYVWALGRDFELSDKITMNVRGQIALTLDDSNIENRGGEAIFSYERTIYGLTFSFVFR